MISKSIPHRFLPLSLRSSGPARSNRCRPFTTLILPLALGLMGAGSLRAASATWNPGTTGDFDTGTNWSTGTPPGDTTAGVTTNNNTATFLNVGTTAVTLTAQRNLGSIVFGAGTGSTALAFTIGTTGGPAFLLSSGGTIISNATAVSETVNAPLVLQNAAAGTNGAYTFESNTPGSSRILTIGGAVTGAATSGSTILTLTGSASTIQVLGGVIADGTAGGNLALVKNGATTWQLNGTNTYTGGTTINAGTLRTATTAASTTSFGTGAITLSGATLAFGGNSFNLTNALVATAGTTSFLSTKGGTFAPSALTGTGNLTFVANGVGITDSFTDFKGFAGTVEVGNSVNLRAVSGVVQNSLQNANLVLDTGGTFLQNLGTNGTVTVAIGSLAGGGTIGGSVAGSGTFTYQVGGNNASMTFGGTLVNGGTVSALNKAGAGTMTLTGTNTYTGTTTISGGTLQIGDGTTDGSISNSANIVNNAALVYNRTTGSSFTYGNVISGTGTLTKTGGGTQALTAANSYSGLTTVSGGTLNINGVNALGGAFYSGITLNGGTLQYATGATGNGSLDVSNIGGTPKPVTFGAGGATIDTNGNTVIYANTVGNGGAGALAKVGTGILTLSAANTYTGGTNINAGTLVTGNSGALGTGAVAINNSAVLNIGDTTVGTPALGTLTLGTSVMLTLSSSATLTLTLANAGTSDSITASGTGSFTLAGTLALNTTDSINYADTYQLFNGGGVTANGLNITGYDTTNYTASLSPSGALTFTLVPEPSTWVMMLGGLGGLSVLAVRRKRLA